MSHAISIPLSQAKTNFSNLIHNVNDAGASYTITLRNKPVAMVVPIPQQAPVVSHTRGLLSSFANSDKRKQESDAFAKAMVDKYENNS